MIIDGRNLSDRQVSELIDRLLESAEVARRRCDILAPVWSWACSISLERDWDKSPRKAGLTAAVAEAMAALNADELRARALASAKLAATIERHENGDGV